MRITGAAVLILMPVLLLACAPGKKDVSTPYGSDLAVAPFHQPSQNWELIGSELPLDSGDMPQEAFDRLNKALRKALAAREVKPAAGPREVKKCRRIALSQHKSWSSSGLGYWSEVGECVSAKYLLVPQILEWRERVGSGWGAERPAKVRLRLDLIQPAQRQVLESFRFNREQKALSENLLRIWSFIRRGGRWVKATELAETGIREGVKELDL